MGLLFKIIDFHRKSAQRFLLSQKFRIFIGIVIVADLTSSILYSSPFGNNHKELLSVIPFLASICFTIEYLERIVAAPYSLYAKNVNRARLRYVFSFFGIVDFISILPFVIPVFFHSQQMGMAELFGISRIFLVFKLARYSRSFREILHIFMIIRRELLATLFFIGVMLVFSSALMYYVEASAQPEVFSSLGQSLWWCINTITSVGYGDIYPITLWGRILGGVTAFFGVLLFALPTALISSAFIKYYTKPGDKIK